MDAIYTLIALSFRGRRVNVSDEIALAQHGVSSSPHSDNEEIVKQLDLSTNASSLIHLGLLMSSSPMFAHSHDAKSLELFRIYDY